jgi:hypothetical protein
MEGMAFGTGQQGTVHSAGIPASRLLTGDRQAACSVAAQGQVAVHALATGPGLSCPLRTISVVPVSECAAGRSATTRLLTRHRS